MVAQDWDIDPALLCDLEDSFASLSLNFATVNGKVYLHWVANSL